MDGDDESCAAARYVDVDMTAGTGWCFGGGPDVGEREGNANVAVKTFEVAAGAKLSEKFDAQKIQALMAIAPGGKSTDLITNIADDGTVDWTAQEASWRFMPLAKTEPTKGQKSRAWRRRSDARSDLGPGHDKLSEAFFRRL